MSNPLNRVSNNKLAISNDKVNWSTEQQNIVIKILPKCSFDSNHKFKVNVSKKQLDDIANSVNKTTNQVVEFLDFEFRNRLFLNLDITSLPIPPEEQNKQKRLAQNKLNLKYRDNLMSQSLAADQFRNLYNKPSNVSQLSTHLPSLPILSNTPTRKRTNNDNNVTSDITPKKKIHDVSYEQNISSNLDEINDLSFIGKNSPFKEPTLSQTFAQVVKNNKPNNRKQHKKSFTKNTKNVPNKRVTSMPTQQNSQAAESNQQISNKISQSIKDMNFKQRYNLLEKAKGPLFRFEIKKWTPVLEADQLIAEKLQPLQQIWLKENVSEKEATKTWKEANKILRTAHRALKSYDTQKIDLEGLRIENQVRIRRSINKTSRFLGTIKKFQDTINTSKNRKEKNSAQAKLRIIVSKNKKKFHNIEQISKFSSDKILILKKRLKTVINNHNKYKIRKRFQLKPSLKSLIDQDEKKYPIPTEKVANYLTDLFSYKKPAEPNLINQWINSTNYPEQNLGNNLFLEDEFNSILQYARPFKAAGLSSVFVAIFKRLKAARTFLCLWIKGILENRIPLTRADVTGRCFSIFKSGSVDDPINYRYINILNSHYKILTKYINFLIQKQLHVVLPFEQFANKKERDGLLDATLINRILQKATFGEANQVQQAWIDFSKAFDSVDHSAALKILEHINIDKRLINIIKNSMKHYYLSLSNNTANKKSRFVKLHKGVYQGDALAPTIFCTVLIPLSYHLNQHPRIKLTDELTINHIMFYDDIKLFTNSTNALATITNLVESYALEVGLTTNRKKCGYTTSDPLPSQDGNFKILIDYSELKNSYKHLGILESQYGANIEENISVLKEAVNKALDITLSSPLSVGEMIQCINTCITPKILFCFSHIGDEIIRNKVAQEFDLLIRQKLNNHKIKMSCMTNSRLYLSREHLGLGLRNTELELDKINLKTYMHIHFTDVLKTLIHKYSTIKDQFLFLCKKYNLEVELIENGVIINNETITNEKLCKYRITHYLNKHSEQFWLQHYTKARVFPATYVQKSLITPWSAETDFRPHQFKNIVMGQENFHPLLNCSANPDKNSRCILLDDQKKLCGRYDNANHILNDCKFNNANKILRHDRTLYELINILSISKNRKFLDLKDLKKSHVFGNIRVEVDMPQKTLLNIFHNRPDLVVFTPNMIYVCDLTICSITNLESAARLKWQRYYLDGSSEITTMIPFMEENKHANKPNICKHLRDLHKLPCHFIPLVFSSFGEIDSKNLDHWQNFFKIFDMEGKKHIARISRRIAMESEFMLYKYFTLKKKDMNNQDTSNVDLQRNSNNAQSSQFLNDINQILNESSSTQNIMEV